MKRTLVCLFLVTASLEGAAFAATCKDYSNCRQAVIAWCAGEHPRADGDGIPCENVCKSKAQVDKIMKEIGCNK